LSQDPRTFAVAGAPFASLAASAQARLLLARGAQDPMVSTSELRLHCQDVHEIPGAGHNVHIERPGDIVGLLEKLLQR
jgi:pimeloyl-ACP methyl ester carboxylesterase